MAKLRKMVASGIFKMFQGLELPDISIKNVDKSLKTKTAKSNRNLTLHACECIFKRFVYLRK